MEFLRALGGRIDVVDAFNKNYNDVFLYIDISGIVGRRKKPARLEAPILRLTLADAPKVKPVKKTYKQRRD